MKSLSKIYTNTNYPLVITYRDTNSAPIDITGATAVFVVRRTLQSTPVINVAGTIDGANGKITFDVTPEDTAGVLSDSDSEKFICGCVLDLTGEKIHLFQTTIYIERSATEG